ncbi:MAG: hypothetical protein WDN24_01140 [Sphingomonas sp.]
MNLPFAPLAALLLGAGAAAAAVIVPVPVLEGLVSDSGIAAIVAAAEPPLGTTARLVVAGGAGAMTALFSWLALFVLLGTRGLTIGRSEAAPAAEAIHTPVIRRADAHPDAPPRAPLLATRDLGTPFLEVLARTRSSDADAGAAPRRSRAAVRGPPGRQRPSHCSRPPRRHGALPTNTTPPPLSRGPLLPYRRRRRRRPGCPSRSAPPRRRPRRRRPSRSAPRRRRASCCPTSARCPRISISPLAAFDPQAIREVPAPLPEAVAPLRHAPRPAVFDSNERFETFELTPMRRDPPRPRPVPEPHIRAAAKAETEATIHALLERLEQGVVRHGLATGIEPERRPRDAERGLEEALVTLRNLARRA